MLTAIGDINALIKWQHIRLAGQWIGKEYQCATLSAPDMKTTWLSAGNRHFELQEVQSLITSIRKSATAIALPCDEEDEGDSLITKGQEHQEGAYQSFTCWYRALEGPTHQKQPCT